MGDFSFSVVKSFVVFFFFRKINAFLFGFFLIGNALDNKLHSVLDLVLGLKVHFVLVAEGDFLFFKEAPDCISLGDHIRGLAVYRQTYDRTLEKPDLHSVFEISGSDNICFESILKAEACLLHSVLDLAAHQFNSLGLARIGHFNLSVAFDGNAAVCRNLSQLRRLDLISAAEHDLSLA